mmetsp:Transcript_15068/g.42827  ORF Transcript_15068/g.42827 Transcript_15068/m.42827 type:complete len:436 (-) Transcript_15068:617-1924(-)
MAQAPGPGKDGSDRIRARFLSLLVISPVAGHRSVRRLALHRLPVRRDQHGRHQAEAAESLGDNVRLHVAIIVLARPHEPALRLQRHRNHIINQAMLIEEPRGLELCSVRRIVHLGEDAHELSIVLLQDRVLGAQVQRIVATQRVLKAGVRKPPDTRLRVVHPESHPRRVEAEDLHAIRLAPILWREHHLQPARLFHHVVGRPILIPERMTPDNDRLVPVPNKTRNGVDHNRLPEHRPVEDVPNGPIRRLPHLFQLELLHARLIGCDGRALDADVVLRDGVCRVDRHLIVRGIPRRHRQVKVLGLHVHIREDELALDPIPDDPRHLVPIDVDDGVVNADLLRRRRRRKHPRQLRRRRNAPRRPQRRRWRRACATHGCDRLGQEDLRERRGPFRQSRPHLMMTTRIPDTFRTATTDQAPRFFLTSFLRFRYGKGRSE